MRAANTAGGSAPPKAALPRAPLLLLPLLLLLLLLLLLSPTGVLCQGTDVQVTNDQQLYNAFIDQTVGSIGLAYNGASLAPYSSALYSLSAPFTVQRSLTVYGALPSGGLPSFDFAYIGGVVRLAAGTTFTLRGLSLYRMQALRTPVGLFATSTGANVVVQDCVNNQQVCWPSEGAQQYFLHIFPRPSIWPGAQVASICAPGTETTCNQYTFTDIGLYVNPSPFGTGDYNMHYVNTIINCQSFPNPLPVCSTLYTDQGPGGNPYNCLQTMYDPANFATICSTCQCINSCRTSCVAQGQPTPAC